MSGTCPKTPVAMPPRWRANPVIYEINSWPWLDGLRRQTGRSLTLDDVPDAEIARLARYNFDAIWLMGIWERSPAACTIAQTNSGLVAAYRQAVPDYQVAEVVGSPYAIYRYRVDPEFGGEDALLVLRRRLREHGLRLILDFVPNHHQETAEIWGRLRVPNRENPLDKQIAATAIINELTVVTRNIANYAPTGVGLLNPFSES
ncbi:MAG: putative glycosyl hydrolase [Gammaproteobacteria bacterium]|nr:putative glycosyl hydrolase [Gammaproteobacteria bacterium]